MKALFYFALYTSIHFSLSAHACGSFPHIDQKSNSLQTINPPVSNEETAWIIWDSKTETQHFIRQASFKNASRDFAFVVPVPSTPDLEEVPKNLLDDLQQRMYGTAISKGMPRDTSAGGGMPSVSPVKVIKQQDVGDMQASVIQSKDPLALQKWLSENGYHVPEAALPWISAYTKKDWQFVAFKLKKSTDLKESRSPFVRISFKTKKPFYPYYEPTDAKQTMDRNFNLFVLSPHKVSATYENLNSWPHGSYTKDFYLEEKNIDKKPGLAKDAKNIDQFIARLLKRDISKEKWILNNFWNAESKRLPKDLIFTALEGP